MNRTWGRARWMGFALSSMALAVAVAHADDTVTTAAPATEHVNVVGQAASIDQALKEQRKSDNIESVVHADGVAQLPDQNVAEATQRLPGVSLERDQGEGRFVSVRGMSPDLNSVTINGTLVPSPESDRRAVALDVLPAELVQSISVIKTLTPDMDANALGGTIEVKSLSAFDHKGLFYTGTSEASYDGNSHQTSPKFSGAISDRFSLGDGIDNFGVAAALSWQKRDFGSDNVETGGDWTGNALNSFEERDYDISRERAGIGLNFDYKPDELSSYYLRTLYSRFKDTESRNSRKIEFSDALSEGETGEAEVSQRLKNRTETQLIQSYVFGGERSLGAWTVSGQTGYSRSSERSPGHIASAVFEADAFDGSSWYDADQPSAILPSAAANASNYSLDKVEWEKQYTQDTEKNIRLDLARDYDLSGYAAQWKFGGKVSRRDKTNDLDSWVYEDFGDAGISDDALNLANYQTGHGISASALKNLIGGLNAADYYDEQESRVNDFNIHEDINAGYLMHTLDIDALRIIAGVRYEGTETDAHGTGYTDGTFSSVDSHQRYHHWLPGLHLRYRLDKDTQVRAAWTNTVVRPTFGQMAPGFVIDDDEATFGNPTLAPTKSSNLDLGIEHFMGRAGTVSAFVFYKDIKDFIYNADLAGTGDYVDFSEAHTYANGDSAKLYGLELAWSQKFDWLSPPFNGLIMGANATFTHSKASFEGYNQTTGRNESRNIDLPNQADRVANLMVGWEDDRLSLRLAANYKSRYLFELSGIDDSAHDAYVDAQTFVDFSARYKLTKSVQLAFDVQNITNEPYFVYSGDSSRNYQYEKYGPTYKLGVTFTHF